MRAIDDIVACHDRPRLRGLDCNFKRFQIDLAKSALAHTSIYAGSVAFLFIGSEVLYCGPDSFALDPLDIVRCQASGK